jgi:hypothetical protein
VVIPPTDYLRLAVDPTRLAVLGAAALGPIDTAALAERLDLSQRRVQREVGRLVEAGLLTAELELHREALREIAAALPQAAGMDPAVADGPWTAEEATILSRFFSGTRLAEIPSNRAKRAIVLERLAMDFEPGLRYTEREVNSVLQVFHPDYATLRRYLVDAGLLSRADGSYWRTGGRVAQ